jgi:hypothetical protein
MPPHVVALAYVHDAAAARELAVAPTLAVHPKAGAEVGASRGDGAANVGGGGRSVRCWPTWAEVGAVSAGVGAATMVSGVDAAVAVRPGFVCERVTPQTTQRWAGVLQ